MRISNDPERDAAYTHFTDLPLEPGRDSIPCGAPPGIQAMAVMGWTDGKITDLEVPDASTLFPADL